MRFLPKIISFLLAVGIVFSSVNRIETFTEVETVYSHSQENEAPAYREISVPTLWAVINLETSASNLLFAQSSSDSEEDLQDQTKLDLARESALERFSSIYLVLSRSVVGSSSVRELLYPFYFYF